ncbi:MDR family NADPH-dependent oxidoreductase [Aspergillus fijiensis CBS 313.89]|uniref:enoyl-[acyl-carrier-protein] reductase n=1 Tax=Aspergillus fijiensis CBS 313.89 TaxID=1448319 RepID=A0A8G1VXF1_9EURO|nr:GroES-like protein [Aspergillus fijiensis CBS 313.89]RAK76560.1 GroES-like protein [Aspergillus fijiensis CBS 313.89]
MAEALVIPFESAQPLDNLHVETLPLPTCGPRQVLVRFLVVPVNPLDFAVIAGQYPVKLQSVYNSENGVQHAIPGSDGAARILQTGAEVDHLAVGDLVILRTHCRGTWRTHGVFDEADLIRVPSTTDPCVASLLRMGVAPAFFQLRDYHTLEPGDWIIQNAATGTISHFVCQLARLLGVQVISVIRARANAEELERMKRLLRSHGASLVLTQEELAAPRVLEGKRIVLAIDSVADDALVRTMAAAMTAGGTVLTAGFLGEAAPPRPEVNLRQFLWQKNISLRPFRLSDCLSKRSQSQQTALFEWFAGLVGRGTLKAPALKFLHWQAGAEAQEVVAAVQGQAQTVIGQRKAVIIVGER